ncbi:MAG: putative RNA uridine N3 methyltransferase [Candidatus Nanohaloarchaea archaeon]|nr:putative RNA uridine N3 methyltransferase [Candidatus Nanohaloarchaea archaeon]
MEILIPSTFGLDERDEKLKVYKFGELSRAISIFGVEQVTIYRDRDPKADEERNSRLLQKHLEYAETPPYLRKALIPHDEDLSNASILPALQILSHGYSDRFREAVVEEVEDGKSILNAGLEEPVELSGEMEEGERVTLQMDEDPHVIEKEEIEGFWTFDVRNERSELGEVVEDMEKPVVGTSRHGDPLNSFIYGRGMDEDFALAFGSHWRGLYDLEERGDLDTGELEGVYNFVPGQHTKTVRTSEAVPIVLGVINALRQL